MSEVTVLMTTYREEEEIFKQALESIIKQTLKDFDILIIVDDSENKEIISIIEEYSKDDNRIQYIINENNLGLPLSLNKGIELINTKYIARMDSDDIADEKRLEKQLKFAKENPDVDLFGCNMRYMDYNSNILYKREDVNLSYNTIKSAMRYVNLFHHPTFFGKTEVFKKNKYRNLKYAQDYDFTCRLLENGYVLRNMQDYLLDYRLPIQKNPKKIVRQKITAHCIRQNYAKKRLTKINIEQEIEQELSKIKEEKIYKAFNIYEEALVARKQNNKIKFIFLILKSSILSKYTRIKFINTIKYYILKKRSDKIENN